MAMTKKQQAIEGFLPVTQGRPGRARGGETEWNTFERPAASPIDTYQRPPIQEVGRSGLEDLGKALSGFSAEIGQAANTYLARAQKAKEEQDKFQKQADEDQAKRLWVANNGQSFAEAMKAGKIPPQASPHFMDAYRTIEGDALGRRFAADIETEYQQWDGRGGNDSDAFSRWLGERVKEKFGGMQDPAMLNGAWPHITALQGKLSNVYQNETAKTLYDGALDTAGMSIGHVIKKHFREGGETGSYDFGAAAGEIDDLTSSLKATGVRGTDLNRIVVDTVVSRAKELQDISILDVLGQKRRNGSPGPGLTQYGAQEIEKAQQSILHDLERGEDLAWKRKERSAKESTRFAIRNVVDILAKDPTAPIPPELIEVGTAGDPDFAIKAEQLRKHVNEGRTQDDPDRLHGATYRVYNSPHAVQAVFDEWAAGNIRNPSTARSMLDDARRIDEARNRGNQGAIQTDIFKRAQHSIKMKMDPTGLDPHVADTALFEMEAAVAEWEEKNPKAGRLDKLKAVRDITDIYLKGVDDVTGEFTSPAPPQQGQQPSPVRQAVTAAATKNGVDPSHLLTTANIESSLGADPRATGNLGQVTAGTAASVGAKPGGGVDQQADTMAKVMAKSRDLAKQTLGRDPEGWEAYAVYQQGPGGGPALLRANPKASAVDTLAAVYGDRAKATSAVVKNGGREDMTAGEFLDHIKTTYQKKEVKAEDTTTWKLAAAGAGLGAATLAGLFRLRSMAKAGAEVLPALPPPAAALPPPTPKVIPTGRPPSPPSPEPIITPAPVVPPNPTVVRMVERMSDSDLADVAKTSSTWEGPIPPYIKELNDAANMEITKRATNRQQTADEAVKSIISHMTDENLAATLKNSDEIISKGGAIPPYIKELRDTVQAEVTAREADRVAGSRNALGGIVGKMSDEDLAATAKSLKAWAGNTDGVPRYISDLDEAVQAEMSRRANSSKR